MFPLDSRELSQLADVLTRAASDIATNRTRAAQRWGAAMAQGLQGEAFEAGRAAEGELIATAVDTADRMQQAARVLYLAATSQAVLERMRVAAIAALDLSSTTLSAALEFCFIQVRVLDEAVAVALYLLNDRSKTGYRLSEYSRLSAAEIDQLQRERLSPQAREALEEFERRQAERGDTTPVHVLETGDGRIVVAVGDIDTADSITTIVAGVSSSNPSSWPDYFDRTARIGKTTGGAAIMWLGYDAPPTVGHAAVSKAASIEGAMNLQQFQRALRQRGAARKGASESQFLTVLGHSNGSFVAGTAGSDIVNGLEADALVLAGSCGAGAHHASLIDLRATDGHGEVYATTGDRDFAKLASGGAGGLLGADPTSKLFGADEVWPSHAEHSDYWDDPEFLRHLGEVVRKKGSG